jgi:hypothetical protein
MQVQAATYRNSQNGSYNYLFTIGMFCSRGDGGAQHQLHASVVS